MPRKRVVPLAADKLRLVHLAKRRLGLEDDDYRRILATVAGVTSSRELTEAGFCQLLDVFARLGFTSSSAAANFGRRDGFATTGQVAAIRRLWAAYHADPTSDAALGRWLERSWGVSALRFVTADQAPRIIGVLKAMSARPQRATVSGAA